MLRLLVRHGTLDLRSLTLERLGQIQAIAVVAACALVPLSGHPWPVAVAGAVGFVLQVLAWRGRYTPRGSFGHANAITTLRLGAVLWVATLGFHAPRPIVASVVVAVMLLDGLDGFVARRLGLASDFGAHLDVEVDAALVLTLGVTLWQRDGLGAWILVPGLLRYAYVLLLMCVPGRGQEPRSVTGRLAFFAVIASLVLTFVDGASVGQGAAAVGTVLLALSFARSLYYSYRPSR